jgi:hypothetical protein
MQLALLPGEDVEMRVRTGPPRPGRTVDVTARQEVGCGLERCREAQESARSQRGRRAVFEVVEVFEVHAGSERQILASQANLATALGDAARQIARTGSAPLRRRFLGHGILDSEATAGPLARRSGGDPIFSNRPPIAKTRIDARLSGTLSLRA